MGMKDRISAEGYRVVREFDAGGMAHVFLADDPSGEPCIVKTPRDEMLPAKSRFYDEARLGMMVRSAHVAETFHFFEGGERPYLVVEYVDGKSLADLLAERPLPAAEVVQIGLDILEALDAIHNATTHDGAALHAVHRDVTPHNILVGKNGTAKLIDLGICSFATRVTHGTQTGAVCGTLRFIAPEMWGGSSFSPRSDLWSLGMCLLEAWTGTKVMEGAFATVVHQVMKATYWGKLKDVIPQEAHAGDLLRVLRTLLQTDPGKRPATAKDAKLLLLQVQAKVGKVDPHAAMRADVDDVLASFLGVDASAPKSAAVDLDGFGALPSSLPSDDLTDEGEPVSDADIVDVDMDMLFDAGAPPLDISMADGFDDERTEVLDDVDLDVAVDDEASFMGLLDDDDDGVDLTASVDTSTWASANDDGIADLLEPSSQPSFAFSAAPSTDVRDVEARLKGGDVQLSLQERNLLYNDMFRALALGLSRGAQKVVPAPAAPVSHPLLRDYIANLRDLERPHVDDAPLTRERAASGILHQLEAGMPLFPWEVGNLPAANDDMGRRAAPIEWLIPETAV